MSLLNCWPDAGVLCVDTDSVDSEGTRHTVSKMAPIPHANAVLGFRGDFALFASLVGGLLAAPAGNVDDLADVVLAVAPIIYSTAARNLDLGARQEILCVGWSPRLERITCMLIEQETRAAGFAKYDWSDRSARPYITPWSREFENIEPTPQNIQVLTAKQVALMHAAYPKAACGGRLLVATVTKQDITIRSEPI